MIAKNTAQKIIPPIVYAIQAFLSPLFKRFLASLSVIKYPPDAANIAAQALKFKET